MCGISGYFGTRPPNKDAEEKCLQLMGRRGPDFAAAERFEHGDRQALLIHSRLSIIDLDARANQPMTVGNTTGIINGEIYNYIELRHELEKQGCSLATKSDTEVFFRLLDQKGVDALDRVEGMWAFAAWDQKCREIDLPKSHFSYLGHRTVYILGLSQSLYLP